MPTDFAPYANLRLLIPQPAAAPANFRSGVPAGAGSWLIHVFAKGPATAAPATPSIDPRTRTLEGYITAWATLPANTSWLQATAGLSWDTTGLAPAGLLTGASGRGFLGLLESLPAVTGQQGEATITALGGAFGTGGIGAELRAQLGDAITVELQVAA
jgi:hypothetical protein